MRFLDDNDGRYDEQDDKQDNGRFDDEYGHADFLKKYQAIESELIYFAFEIHYTKIKEYWLIDRLESKEKCLILKCTKSARYFSIFYFYTIFD